MFTRPTPGRLLTTDDLIRFIEELEASQQTMYGDGLTVESPRGDIKVAVDPVWQATQMQAQS